MITRHDIAFMVQEIISECHARPKGAEMIDLIDKYAAKFGKDNSGMVPMDELKRILELPNITSNTENAKTKQDALVELIEKYNKGIYKPTFSQQPPKERKVSLEEIKKIVKDTRYKIINNAIKTGQDISQVDPDDDIAQAILSLLNAVLDGKEGG